MLVSVLPPVEILCVSVDSVCGWKKVDSGSLLHLPRMLLCFEIVLISMSYTSYLSYNTKNSTISWLRYVSIFILYFIQHRTKKRHNTPESILLKKNP